MNMKELFPDAMKPSASSATAFKQVTPVPSPLMIIRDKNVYKKK